MEKRNNGECVTRTQLAQLIGAEMLRCGSSGSIANNARRAISMFAPNIMVRNTCFL
jgi:hypothetical protein